jgi:hypothetical protein
VRETGEHHVLELVQLRDDGGTDARIRVSEEVDPPRAHAVEIATTVEVIEPRAFAARDRHERHCLVLLHLRAGMPDGSEAALEPAAACANRASDARRLVGRGNKQVGRVFLSWKAVVTFISSMARVPFAVLMVLLCATSASGSLHGAPTFESIPSARRRGSPLRSSASRRSTDGWDARPERSS